MQGEIWEYRPHSHKGEHHREERLVYLGPAFPRICFPFSLNFFPVGKSGSVFGGRDSEELEDTALQGG